MNQPVGKYIMLAGALIFIAGLIWYFFGNKLNWIGRLPGDVRIEKQNFKFYLPITTMILISVVITVLIRLFRKFF